MPQVRFYNNRKIKSTKRLVRSSGETMIRITYYGNQRYEPGPQEYVSEDSYKAGRTVQFVKSKHDSTKMSIK